MLEHFWTGLVVQLRIYRAWLRRTWSQVLQQIESRRHNFASESRSMRNNHDTLEKVSLRGPEEAKQVTEVA